MWTAKRLGRTALLFLAALDMIECFVSETSIESLDGLRRAFLIVDQFGMAEGGLINVQIVSDASSSALATIVLADSNQALGWYEPLVKDATGSRKACQGPSAARYQVPLASGNDDQKNFPIFMPYSSRYSLYVLLCDLQQVQLRVISDSVNPDSSGKLVEHLQYQFIPLPSVYCLIAVSWVCLLISWCAFMQRIKVQPIHKWFACVAFLKVVESLSRSIAWSRLSRLGTLDFAGVWTSLVSTITEILVVYVLLFLCREYGRDSLFSFRGERLLLTCLFIIYAALTALSNFCGQGSSCRTYELLSYCVRFLILLNAIVSVNLSIAHIRSTLYVPWSHSLLAEYVKLRQLHLFRWAFVAFLLIQPATLYASSLLLGWQYQWLEYALGEFLFALVCVSIATIFIPMPSHVLARALHTRS